MARTRFIMWNRPGRKKKSQSSKTRRLQVESCARARVCASSNDLWARCLASSGRSEDSGLQDMLGVPVSPYICDFAFKRTRFANRICCTHDAKLARAQNKYLNETRHDGSKMELRAHFASSNECALCTRCSATTTTSDSALARTNKKKKKNSTRKPMSVELVCID